MLWRPGGMIAGMTAPAIYPAFGRYPTPEAKAHVLEEWEKAKTRIRPADDPDGHGPLVLCP